MAKHAKLLKKVVVQYAQSLQGKDERIATVAGEKGPPIRVCETN